MHSKPLASIALAILTLAAVPLGAGQAPSGDPSASAPVEPPQTDGGYPRPPLHTPSANGALIIDLDGSTYAAGQNIRASFWMHNLGTTEIVTGAHSTELLILGPFQGAAVPPSFDPVTLTLNGAHLTPAVELALEGTVDGLAHIPTSAACPILGDQPIWNQQLPDGTPAPPGLYVVVGEAMAPGDQFFFGMRPFVLGVANTPGTSVGATLSQSGPACVVDPPADGQPVGSAFASAGQAGYHPKDHRHWDTFPVTWRYNSANQPFSSAQTAITAAAQVWESDVPSRWDQNAPAGTVTNDPTNPGDGMNTVGWSNNVGTCGALTANTATRFSWNGRYSQMIEADTHFCRVNTRGSLTWSDASGAVSGAYDLRTAALHEAGHFAGMGHVGYGSACPDCIGSTADDPEAMNWNRNTNTAVRTLGWGDQAGIRWIYPLREVSVSSTATGDRTGVGPETSDMDVAAAGINAPAQPDVVTAWTVNDPGDNSAYYRVGFDVSATTGQPLTYSDIFYAFSSMGHDTAGLGAALSPINGLGGQDLVIAWVDDATQDNAIYYKVGWDLSTTTGRATSWAGTQTAAALNTGVGWYTQGLGACVMNLDSNSRPDLVLAWMDNPSGANDVRYKVLYNLDTSGVPTSFGTIQTWLPSDGRTGDTTQGLGLACTDLDGNGKADIALSWMDNPSGENNVRVAIGLNPNSSGAPASWVTSAWNNRNFGRNTYLTPPGTNAEWWGPESQGFGLTAIDVNHANSWELYYAWVENPSGENRIHARLEWDGMYWVHEVDP